MTIGVPLSQVNMVQEEGRVLVVEVLSAATAAVGVYKVVVETSNKLNRSAVKTFTVPTPLYLIFNPYCKGL